jgi:hypothetical protein
MSIPIKFLTITFHDEDPKPDLCPEYSKRLDVWGYVRTCPNTIPCSELQQFATENVDGSLTIKTQAFLSSTADYLIHHYTNTYLGLAKLMTDHRSRFSTFISRKNQWYELNNTLKVKAHKGLDVKRDIGIKFDDRFRETFLHVAGHKLDNLREEINPVYRNKDASALPGVKWPTVASSSVMTAALYRVSYAYLEAVIYALDRLHPKFMYLHDLYNIGIRGRSMARFDVGRVNSIMHDNVLTLFIDAIETVIRGRLVFYIPGASSVNSLQKGRSKQEVRDNARSLYKKAMYDPKLMGMPKEYVTLYSDGATLYDRVMKMRDKGYYIAAFDGSAQESATGVITGRNGTPFATYLWGLPFYTSGNFLTSFGNTAVIGAESEYCGLFERGYTCIGCGDDKNIFVKDLTDIQRLIDMYDEHGVGEFMQFQPMDTLSQYVLGFTFLDKLYPHSLGIKLSADSAGAYVVHPLDMWWTYKKKFADNELMAYRQVFTDVSKIIPILGDIYDEDIDAFSPRSLRERIIHNTPFELNWDPGPVDRDIDVINADYLDIRNCIPEDYIKELMVLK